MKFCIFLILSIIGIASAQSESWQCRNDLEINCSDGKCESKTKNDFTQMSVSFDESGRMNVCAYTGCWEGTGAVTSDSNFLMLSGKNLKFSTSDSTENIAITLDKNDNIAMVKAGEFAQPLICKKNLLNADAPKFSQYKVNVSTAKPKPLKFAGNRDAWMFRTRLKRANKDSVNFAGHYVFAIWGCGTSCVHGAIINTQTGVVYFPDELGGMSFGNLADDDVLLDYRKDSKLFVLKGIVGGENVDKYKQGTHYLVWEGTKFKQVDFVPFDGESK